MYNTCIFFFEIYRVARFDDTCTEMLETIRDRKTFNDGSFRQFYYQLRVVNSVVETIVVSTLDRG